MEKRGGVRMIYVVDICSEDLFSLEFVSPIEDIIRKSGKSYELIKIDEMEKIKSRDQVIICGTGLLDDEHLLEIQRFNWIKDLGVKVLGICAGSQIIGKVFGAEIKEELEIGFFKEEFNVEFLGILSEQEVYHLHHAYADFHELEDFEVYAGEKVAQAVKHKEKEIYGVLFHPEVRQKELVVEFIDG